MKNIYKYPLKPLIVEAIILPIGYELLSIQLQNNIPCIWALIDDQETSFIDVNFYIYATGEPIYNIDKLDYICTLQSEMNLVFHYFKEKNK